MGAMFGGYAAYEGAGGQLAVDRSDAVSSLMLIQIRTTHTQQRLAEAECKEYLSVKFASGRGRVDLVKSTSVETEAASVPRRAR